MPPKGVPSGPRSARQSTRQTNPRQPNRGGIQKRGATPQRPDRDGDLDMTEASARGARIGRSGRGASIRGAATSERQLTPDSGSHPRGRPRVGIDATAVQRAVLREMGSDEKVTRASRGRTHQGARDSSSDLRRLRIKGLRESKAAGNRDGGIGDLLAFLERKATHANEAPVKIVKSRMEDHLMIISVKPPDATRIAKLDGFLFAGAKLDIKELEVVRGAEKTSASDSSLNMQGPNTIEVLKDFLGRRYNPTSKLLDLSRTGSDSQLINVGMFKTTTTESKFFPALMKVCDGFFTSVKEKEEAVLSVSLANNNLPNVTAVTTLAQTFPDLKNLDLSNNQFVDLKALESWRWKFRKMQNVVLLGNSINADEANIKDELLKWYPELITINGIQVRTQDEIELLKGKRLPLPILGASFQDEGAVAENFLKQYFLGFDSDRNALVSAYYDQSSTFSLNINVSAPRKTDGNAAAPSKWDNFIRRSRNLSRLSSAQAKKDRLYTGANAIGDCFASLPKTRHPDLLSDTQKWCVECNTLPGLPDPSGQSAAGVGGLLIIVHGEFSELDLEKANVSATRSFDRTFILGPGSGLGGVRVICDTLGLRSHGGSDAWIPENSAPQPIEGGQSGLPQMQNLTPNNGNTTEQAHKEALAIELSTRTRMTVEYSVMCLEQSGWDLDNALVRFEEVKSTLPSNAFMWGIRSQ